MTTERTSRFHRTVVRRSMMLLGASCLDSQHWCDQEFFHPPLAGYLASYITLSCTLDENAEFSILIMSLYVFCFFQPQVNKSATLSHVF